MLSFLLWISPVVVIAVIVWKYRRQAAAREAASNERFKEFLGKRAAQEVAEVAPARPTAGINPVPAMSAPAPIVFAARERLLTPPQTLLYYLLKSGLSDHEVLAQVSVATLMDSPATAAAFERETRQRRLSAAIADFVVCDKSFKAMAVVQCGARDGAAAEALAFARTGCESAGLRWIEVAPDALPRRDTIKSLVLGV